MVILYVVWRLASSEVKRSREDFTRANTEASPQAANKPRLDFAKKHQKSQSTSGKAFFGREMKINLYQNDRSPCSSYSQSLETRCLFLYLAVKKACFLTL